MDLFASQLTHQLKNYVSWRPDPGATATDAFTLDWTKFMGYVNPPWNLVGRVLTHVRSQQAKVTLIAQIWSSAETIPSPGEPIPDTPDSQSQQTRSNTPSSHMGYLRERFRSQNLSEEASKLVLSSWRQKQFKSYDSLFEKWVCWCHQRDTNPISGDINNVVNFLAELFQQGCQYQSLNVYRWAVSSVHEKAEVGQHLLITRLIKGAFHERPPQPRYTATWDVAAVTGLFEALGNNEPMHINNLTHKTAMLYALTHPSWSADLVGLSVKKKRYSLPLYQLDLQSSPDNQK